MYSPLQPVVVKVLPGCVVRSSVLFQTASQLGTVVPSGFILTKMMLARQPVKVTEEALEPEPLIQTPSSPSFHVHAYQSSVPVEVAEALSVTVLL